MPIAEMIPKKRGRVAKMEIDEASAVVEPPKKRGRPSKAKAEEPAAVAEPTKRGRRSLAETPVTETSAPKKRAGRPVREKVAEEATSAPEKRAGRSNKADAAVEDAPALPKRRGQPAKNAPTVDLNRVAGSPRITKTRSKPAARGSKIAAAAQRLNPVMRSKLRTQQPPKPKVEPAPQPAKRRGRPAKAAVALPPSPKKASGRKAKNAAITKPTAPRKKRGITNIEVPDKFAAQVQQYLQNLLDADSLPTRDADDAEEVDVEAGDEGQDADMVQEEENIMVTSATADEDIEEDGVMVVYEEIQEEYQEEIYNEEPEADAEVDYNAQEDDIQDEVVVDVIIHEHVQYEGTTQPNTPNSQGEAEMIAHQQTIQMEQQDDVEDDGLLRRDFDDENDEPQTHKPTPIFDENSDSVNYAPQPEPRLTAGVIFG